MSKAMLLLAGAILCRGGRTVCAVLKILGMQGEENFDKYHRILSRASWNPLEGGKILLKQLMDGMAGPLVIAVDEHIERRQGRSNWVLPRCSALFAKTSRKMLWTQMDYRNGAETVFLDPPFTGIAFSDDSCTL